MARGDTNIASEVPAVNSHNNPMGSNYLHLTRVETETATGGITCPWLQLAPAGAEFESKCL